MQINIQIFTKQIGSIFLSVNLSVIVINSSTKVLLCSPSFCSNTILSNKGLLEYKY